MRWDRKRSPKPNLHVCGEDDMKRTVYNMKESIEKGGIRTSENKEYSEVSLENKRTELVSKEKLNVIALLIHLQACGLTVFLLKLT